MNFIYFLRDFIIAGFLLLLIGQCAEAKDFKIMIIDTGIDPTHEAFEGFGFQFSDDLAQEDQHGHGTKVASLILNGELDQNKRPKSQVCKQVKTIICRAHYGGPMNTMKRYLSCLQKALADDVILINFSSSGVVESREEYELIKALSNNQTIFVTAAGNAGLDLKLKKMYPASYADELPIFVVGSLDDEGKRLSNSNWGTKMFWQRGLNIRTADVGGKYSTITGTSAASALLSNLLINKLCKKLNEKSINLNDRKLND